MTDVYGYDLEDDSGKVIKVVYGRAEPPIATTDFAAKAWATFYGEDGTLLGTGNVATVARVAKGEFKVTFVSPMQDPWYSISGTCQRNLAYADNTGDLTIGIKAQAGTPRQLAGEVTVTFRNSTTGALEDPYIATLHVVR